MRTLACKNPEAASIKSDMTRHAFSRALHAKSVVLVPRPTNLERRQASLRCGAILTLVPALTLLPVVGLVVTPRFAHARVLGGLILTLIIISECKGLPRLAHCLHDEFDNTGALAFGALILLLLLLIGAGILLVSFFLTAAMPT